MQSASGVHSMTSDMYLGVRVSCLSPCSFDLCTLVADIRGGPMDVELLLPALLLLRPLHPVSVLRKVRQGLCQVANKDRSRTCDAVSHSGETKDFDASRLRPRASTK